MNVAESNPGSSSNAAVADGGGAPLVGLALPVYNGERYVAEALESVLGQTLGDFELVISDNASTDGTAEICERYCDQDPRVRYVRQPRNVGAALNFNSAFHATRGRYFKWAACDDVLEPTYLERCVAALEAHPEAPFAHSYALQIDENGKEVGEFELERAQGAEDAVERFRAIIDAYDFSGAFALMRREALLRTGLLRLYSGADRLLVADLLLAGRPCLVPERLFRWRQHAESFRERENQGSGAAMEWWVTGARKWPLRTTVCMLGHGSWVVLRSSLPLAKRLSCLGYLTRWASQPLLRRIMRIGAKRKRSASCAYRVRESG